MGIFAFKILLQDVKERSNRIFAVGFTDEFKFCIFGVTMGFSFNEAISRKKIVYVMTLAATLSLALCAFFGELALPVFTAFYAFLIIADTSSKKIVSVAIGAVALAVSISLYIFDFGTLSLPFACIGGVLIALLFNRGISKGELAFYLTALFTVMLVGSLYLSFAAAAGDYSLSAVTEYINGWYAELRLEFVSSIMDTLKETSSELFLAIDELTVSEAFDSLFNFSPSAIVIFAFALTGVALKIFSTLSYKLAKEPQRVIYWRFATSSVIAYFYCALFVLNFFAAGNEVFAITVSNLFYVFLAVYAYIGYNFALSIISGRLGYALSVIIVIAIILLFGIIALELLSLLGVVFTHISNKVGWHIDNNKS